MNTTARAVIIFNLLAANNYYPLTVFCIQQNLQERQISIPDHDVYYTLYELEKERMVCAARSDQSQNVYWGLGEKSFSLGVIQ